MADGKWWIEKEKSSGPATWPSMYVTPKDELANGFFNMLDSFTQQTNANAFYSQEVATLHIKSLKKEPGAPFFNTNFSVETMINSFSDYYFSRLRIAKPHSIDECKNWAIYYLMEKFLKPYKKLNIEDNGSPIKQEIINVGEKIKEDATKNEMLASYDPQKRSTISFLKEYYNAIPAIETMELDEYYDITIGNLTAPLGHIDLKYVIGARDAMDTFIKDLGANKEKFDQILTDKNNKLNEEFKISNCDEQMTYNAKEFVKMFSDNNPEILEKVSNLTNPLDAIEFAFEVSSKSTLNGIKKDNIIINSRINSFNNCKDLQKNNANELKQKLNDKAEVQ